MLKDRRGSEAEEEQEGDEAGKSERGRERKGVRQGAK